MFSIKPQYKFKSNLAVNALYKDDSYLGFYYYHDEIGYWVGRKRDGDYTRDRDALKVKEWLKSSIDN